MLWKKVINMCWILSATFKVCAVVEGEQNEEEKTQTHTRTINSSRTKGNGR